MSSDNGDDKPTTEDRVGYMFPFDERTTETIHRDGPTSIKIVGGIIVGAADDESAVDRGEGERPG